VSRDFNPPYNKTPNTDKKSQQVRNRSRSLKLGRFRLPISFSCLAVAYLAGAALFSASAAQLLHSRSRPLSESAGVAFNSSPAKYLVLMVLDGGRPDYLDLTALPHLDALRSQGTQFNNTMLGILEAETPAGHATISTGSTPVRDGILGFDWMQNDNDYSLFSTSAVNGGAFDQIMLSAHTPTLASLYKARFPKAKVVALSGHKYYAAAPLGGPKADVIMYYEGDAKGRYVPVGIPNHMPPASVLNTPGLVNPTTRLKDGQDDGFATKLALATFAKMRQRMTLINYPEFDWPLGHVDGGITDRAKVITDIRQLDNDLGKIENAYKKAGILDQTLFVITADHGMDPVNRFIPESTITTAISEAGAVAPTVSYNSGAYVWLSDTSKAQSVAERIVSQRQGDIQSVYYLSEKAGKPVYVMASGSFVNSTVEKANEYLLSTLLNGHQPSVVAFAKEGATFTDPLTRWKADHGGNGWQSQHIPLILSGPGIQAGKVVNTPAQLEDLAPTVLTAMGVAPTGMQGRVLTEALVNPSTAEEKARSTELTQIGGLNSALAAQDKSESKPGGRLP
jgi:Type I phosphodiesterase / nucleotide pyrophosphatase